MSGLNTSLTIATQAVLAQDGALQITNNNIANATTPGYSRQIVTLSSAAMVQGNSTVGDGVVLGGFTSVRNQILQLNLQQQTSIGSGADTQSSALQAIQSSFAASGTDLGSSLSTFFSSISALATDPTNTSSRQAILSAGQSLTTAFHRDSAALTQLQSNADSQIPDDVSQINKLTSQIAQLSAQLAPVLTSGGDGGSLTDQKNQLVLQLSKLTGVSEIKTESGDTLTIGNGTPLVVAGQSFPLQVTTGTDGLHHILDSTGTDITSSLASASSGSIGGALHLRDNVATGLRTQLDTLASQFAGAINTAQASGYDANGAAGQPLFAVPSTVSGAAANIALTTTDPALVAASADGTPNSNGNLAKLSAIQNSVLPSGESPTSAYASLVYNVGEAASTATATSDATQLSLQQLTDQIGSVSGVSIDEESANLVRFQQSYEASAKVITTINTLYSVILNMSNGGGGY